MNNKHKLNALQTALQARSTLSFEAACEQLPAFIAAEQAGDDVETAYADLLIAIDQYPELADLYAELSEACAYSEQDAATFPANAVAPSFFAPKATTVRHSELVFWGRRKQNLLFNLNYYGAKSIEDPVPASIKYVDTVIDVDSYALKVAAHLEARAEQWELVVTVESTPEASWELGVDVAHVPLAVLDQAHNSARFGPLTTLPVDSIVLTLKSNQAT